MVITLNMLTKFGACFETIVTFDDAFKFSSQLDLINGGNPSSKTCAFL